MKSSPGDRADLMVQAQNLDGGDLLDHRLLDWARCFDQVSPHLLEPFPPSLEKTVIAFHSQGPTIVIVAMA